MYMLNGSLWSTLPFCCVLRTQVLDEVEAVNSRTPFMPSSTRKGERVGDEEGDSLLVVINH